ncbi:hypothetical protein UFOVP107_24 [uncultured Caudovirales phage]|uniref:Uncharacterized protein n=1 Tax=uncultured Caudovirales phage TaxID=2100421 RepID=A0A6J7WP64_9CAUD|nr:hypothetical protein UFOVP107_24 [uncultured Caudovirales phage]CAB5218522.1 hypothetical protein UFOVP214_27 [uncultured Caudovirales phage]
MNEFVFEPTPPRVHAETLRLFGQTVQFTKHGDMCNGIFQFNGLTHLLSWETIGYKRELYIDGVQIKTSVEGGITDIRFMQALASLHKLTAWQQCELFHEWFETYTAEHITYEVAGIEFYAETSIDDTAWRYVTEDDDRCWHTSRWFNGMEFKPCLHHFRHWINSTIEYKEDYEK